MKAVLLLVHLTLFKWFAIINAEETNNFNRTSILRYGHHRTHKCLDFQKAYVCINRCLERGYDIASADENCKCSCFKDAVKAKHLKNKYNSWKMPTTTRPAWAGSDPLKKATKGTFLIVSPEPTYKIPVYLKFPVNGSSFIGGEQEDASGGESEKETDAEEVAKTVKSGEAKNNIEDVHVPLQAELENSNAKIVTDTGNINESGNDTVVDIDKTDETSALDANVTDVVDADAADVADADAAETKADDDAALDDDPPE